MPAEKGNQRALKHGGAGAELAHRQGRDFVGLAAVHAQEVHAEMEASGPEHFIRKNAEGLQVCADLYLDAILKANADGDQDKIDVYIHKWGWLVNSATRWMLELRKIMRDNKSGPGAIDILQSYMEKQRDEETTDTD